MSETVSQNAIASGQTFVWHEVYAPTTEASIDFYTKALDFGTASMSMGEMGDYLMLTKNGIPVAGVLGTAGNPMMEGVPPHWATYIGVAELDASLAKCIEFGATVVVPTITVPTVGLMSLIKDPSGAMVWLFEAEMPAVEVVEVETIVIPDLEAELEAEAIAEIEAEIVEEAIAEAIAEAIVEAEIEEEIEEKEEEEEEAEDE